MLVLSRKKDQAIQIGTTTLQVLKIERGRVRLGIVAPPGTTVLRQELEPWDDAKREKPCLISITT